MKLAFIITSVLEPSNTPLTYSSTRSVFDSRERLSQTIFTVSCLNLITKNNATLFLLDLSENEEPYKSALSYQKNLVFINVKKEYPEIVDICRNHKNKSYGECLLLHTFISNNLDLLNKFDYVFKISGRYFTDGNFNLNIFNKEHKNKLFFKSPLKWEWSDRWNYEMVDRRHAQNDNYLYQYSSVLFGWGSDQNHLMSDMFYEMYQVLDKHTHFDIETLIYFFTRPYENQIIETNWTVCGWNSTNGKFTRY